MNYPKKVKFIGYSTENPLYLHDMTHDKVYKTTLDNDEIALEIFEENEVVTVFDDIGDLHEIEPDDYIIIE